MNIIKLTPEQIKLFETLGFIATLGGRKTFYVPFFFIQHGTGPADEFELFPIPDALLEPWEDFQRYYDPVA